MKSLLTQYASYNLWANKRICTSAKLLTEAQVHQEVVSSFPSVYKTVLHLVEVEHIWWERLHLAEHDPLPGWFTGDFEQLSIQLSATSAQWIAWIQEAKEAHFSHVFAYKNSRKQQFKQPYFEMLLHLFNHQTFHRGQLVTMMRQLGVTKILPTDFIVFQPGGTGDLAFPG